MAQELMELADNWAEGIGAWGYALLVLAALLEYLFPPFPGDSLIALGGAWAWRTSHAWLGVWLAVTLGNILGIGLQHQLGRLLSHKAAGGWLGRRLEAWGLTPARMEQMKAQIHKWGIGLLLANRFLPSLRALVFLAAGTAGLSFRKTMLWGVLGSTVWSAFILGLGAWVGGNAERLLALLEGYQRAAGYGVMGATLALGAYLLWRRQRRRRG